MAQSRLLLALLLVSVCGWSPASPVRAQTVSNVFQVSGIPVDATAADAVAAREQALLQGQIEGLRRLLRRLAPATAHERLPAVGPGQIQAYVSSFEIADERVSSERYLAQLTVRYDPDAVRELLQTAALPYAETVSMPIVVLPVYRTGNGPRLWPDDNPWWQAWAEHLDSERLLRLILPLGDLQDMATVTPDGAMAGDTAALAALAQRYGADDVLLVIATPRGSGDAAADAEASAAAAPPALELEVRRSGIEQPTPPETLVARPGETLEALMAEAVVGLQDSLDERWKSANLLRYDQAGTMVVDIPIARLSDWVEISRGLQGLTEVDRVDITMFARNNVRAQIRYIGDQIGFEEALGRLGLALSRKGESWLLLPMAESQSPGAPANATSTSS
ncbi:MAG: DUF2066 domain-containing protein [Geminicoccaceae bacterium]